jgi:hypothetical protein
MPIKDMKEPPGSATAPDDSQHSPWSIDASGRRKRNTSNVRSLPLEVRLREFFVGLSGAAALAGDGFTANAIEAKAEELAYGYAKLAQMDPRVKRILTTLLEGSAWTEALVPTLGLVIIVGWHYGVIPDKLGVPMTLANGMIPVTRDQEKQMREQANREQAEAQAAAQARQAAGGNGKPGDGDTSD